MKRLHFRAFDPAPLVSLSTDYYPARPLTPRGWRIVVIVKPAGFRSHEIVCLVTLPGCQHTPVDPGAIGVLGMWIGRHVVTPRIVIHEEHTGAERNRQFLRRDPARRECKRVGIGRSRRRRGRGATAAARRKKQHENQDEAFHWS